MSTIIRLVCGQTKNPTWDVMLAISRGLDIPLDEFSGQQNLRIIREPEMNHMQKYRALNSMGKEAVDEYLETEYQEWLETLARKELFSHKKTVDQIYSMSMEDIEKMEAYMKTLEKGRDRPGV
ncbi:hypothetical protein AAEU42_09465 [Pseudoflavonifractor phocaeensis]|uniref:hypothetical protein n=1 Tax=Pseudoflavonifractor phocaeensis TaxID=1870988 RepID=UPI00313B845A